ncbi:hypothetical protein [Phytohabitans kaempferiae]|uniref:DUF4304 domain-containing protein n=1 Tax=Phytohabitans kaempferiae TaxID=1620943 RepID=A0ABV6MD91_9ACTN
MRKRPASFEREASQRFQFLVDQHGFAGPGYSDRLLPLVTYHRRDLRISIHLQSDPHDGAGKRISVSISLTGAGGWLKADLDALVEAALYAPRHRVAWKAHTADAMRGTLDDNATWIRRLMPLLQGPDALDTVRRANRHETDKTGNPKRRPPGIEWKYEP